MPPKKITQVTLYEKPNIDLLRRVIASPDITEAFRTSLTAYYAKKDDKGVIPVTYTFSTTLKTMGRLYADRGLQGCMREIRCLLSEEMYMDIDITNCHPTLLYQYCTKKGISCKELKKYVKRREEYLSLIMNFHNVNRFVAKKLILRLCYGGAYKLNLTPDGHEDLMNDDVDFDPSPNFCPDIELFAAELKQISRAVRKIETDLTNIVLKDLSKENKNACIMSIHAQRLEHECLMCMYKFFQEKFIPVGVLVFDGIMIEKCDKFNESNYGPILKACERYVSEKTKYHISLVNKSLIFDEKKVIHVPNVYPFVEDADEARQQLFRVYGSGKFKCCNDDLYVFDNSTGLFSSSKDVFNKILTQHKEFLRYKVGSGFKSYGGGTISARNEILKEVRCASIDDEWLENTHKSSIFHLLFKNGIYNMKTGIFTKGFNENIVFHAGLNFDFPERSDEDIEYAMEYSFGSICEQGKIDQLIIPLACALAGDVSVKKIYFGLGDTNRGKSTLVKMLQSVFGRYVGFFDGNNFAIDKSKSDAAAKNRWALLKSSCRILLASEISMEDSLDGNTIKKHSSGGDTIVARVHQGLETEVSPNYTCFLFVNDKPDIFPFDDAIDKRIEFINFPYEFVKDVTTAWQKKAIDLSEIIMSDKFKRGFLWILLDGYRRFLTDGLPEFEPSIRSKWMTGVSSRTNLKSFILEHFEFVEGDEKCYTSVRDINAFRKEHSEFSGLSVVKYNELLYSLGASKTVTNKKGGVMETVDIKGKTTRVWFFIRVKPVI